MLINIRGLIINLVGEQDLGGGKALLRSLYAIRPYYEDFTLRGLTV